MREFENKPFIEQRESKATAFEDALGEMLTEIMTDDALYSSQDFGDALNEQLYDACEVRTVDISSAERENYKDNTELDELRDEYIDDLKENSKYPETIDDNGEIYEKTPSEKNAEMREEFNEKREELIKEWEEKTGIDWPRYQEDVYDEKTGTLIRKAGDRYDAHHIQPLSLGGKNEAGNITPVHANSHYDRRGIHAPDSPYAKMEKHCKE